MAEKITLHDLNIMFGEDFIPQELDKKILMKHFDVGANRIIGAKTLDKVKEVLLTAIEATKAEQFREKGRVISSPAARYHQHLSVSKESQSLDDDEEKDSK
ncbi:MAG: hypothetical protein KAJ76_01450 [Candidatus Heimdallarchaeota archaeon]|nr:hypothetical protein [Candidatus Heimdallarchaeota archaeon]MCK5297540.1 hypothetical protein [Candidatus Heimdallarchaeota archaeon]